MAWRFRGREVLGARAHARTSLKALMTERKFFFLHGEALLLASLPFLSRESKFLLRRFLSIRQTPVMSRGLYLLHAPVGHGLVVLICCFSSDASYGPMV